MKFEMPKRKSELLKIAGATLLALVVMGILLFPVYYMFTISLKPSGTLATSDIDLIPDRITLENYREIIFGHQEGLIKTANFKITADTIKIRDTLNRYELIVEGGTVSADYSGKLTLGNMKVEDVRGGTTSEESDATLIRNGEYIRASAESVEAVVGIKKLNVEGSRIILKVSKPEDSPVDLSGFTKTGEGTYEAENVNLYLPDGGKIEASAGTFEANNFDYIRIAKVGGQVWGYMKRSLIIASLTVVLTLLFVIPSAYAFSRLKFFGREHILYFYLMFTQVAGGLGIAGLVALYGMLVKLHLTNNIYVLPLIYAAGSVPFNTWLLKGYLDSISPDFDEAALVDGAGYLQIIRHVLIPMSLPGLATVAIFAFIGGWTELILANLLLNQDKHPLTVWIYTMLANLRSVSWNEFAAAALIFALPVFVMFLLAQNYVRSGLTIGGLKE